MINYFIRLISLKMPALPKRKLDFLERKLLSEVENMESKDIMLFNIAFVSDKGEACTYVAVNTTHHEIYEYAILKANLLYYENATIH